MIMKLANLVELVSSGSLHLGAKTIPKGSQNGTKREPKRYQKGVKMVPKGSQKRYQKGPKMAGKVKELREFLHYSMYADNVKLVSAIWDERDMITMQETLNIVHSWAEDNGMIFSAGKTKVLKIGREVIIGQYFGAEEEELEFEEQLKDLGVLVGCDGTMAPTLEEVIGKVRKTSW